MKYHELEISPIGLKDEVNLSDKEFSKTYLSFSGNIMHLKNYISDYSLRYSESLVPRKSDIFQLIQKPQYNDDEYALFKEKSIKDLWKSNYLISSKVYKIDNENNLVFCECAMDKDNMIFEKRVFPKNLFGNIQNLKLDSYVLIEIKSRPGTILYRIHDGKNMGLEKDFDNSDIWKSLEGLKSDETPLKSV